MHWRRSGRRRHGENGIARAVMRTIERIGVVTAVSDEEARVSIRPPAERDCSSCCACAMGAERGRKLQVKRSDLREGDCVRITMPVCSGYLSALVVFVVPMVLTIAGMLVGARFEPDSGAGAATLVGGGAGFALAVVIALLVNGAVTGRRRYVVEHISRAEALAACEATSGPTAPE